MNDAPAGPAIPRPAGPLTTVRSLAFVAWMYGLLVVMGLVCAPLLLGPRSWVLPPIHLWRRLVLGGLRVLCGVRIEVRGAEHAPRGPALVAAKHQSMLDTIAPLTLMADPAYVLKQELMRLPVYAWYVRKADMIPIDREANAKTLRALIAAARVKLAAGRPVVIFPEGTRQEPGAAPDYKPGVAALYRDLDVPCTPMATNSGRCWPAHGFVRRPGVAVFEFLPPIPRGLKRAEFMARLETAIETASNRLLASPAP